MKRFSIIHPSRGRPIQALNTLLEWKNNCSNWNDVEYLIGIDSDDDSFKEYKTLFSSHKIDVIEIKKTAIYGTVYPVNELAKYATGDIFIIISDDFSSSINWDSQITSTVSKKENFVLKTFDGFQKWICTLMIIDRHFYNSQKYCLYPEYIHFFADADLTHFAEVTGRLIINNNIIFKHNHITSDKTGKEIRNFGITNKKDMQTYLKRVKDNFNLSNIDVLKISDKKMKNWLNSNLR